VAREWFTEKMLPSNGLSLLKRELRLNAVHRTDWPAVKPETQARSEPASAGDRALKNPITSSAGCCARTASGHETPRHNLNLPMSLAYRLTSVGFRLDGASVFRVPTFSWDDIVYSRGFAELIRDFVTRVFTTRRTGMIFFADERVAIISVTPCLSAATSSGIGTSATRIGPWCAPESLVLSEWRAPISHLQQKSDACRAQNNYRRMRRTEQPSRRQV
jgi:hypothetical protein